MDVLVDVRFLSKVGFLVNGLESLQVVVDPSQALVEADLLQAKAFHLNHSHLISTLNHHLPCR